MRTYFYLLFALPVLLFSQNNSKEHDYFIQFNTPQFAKKVNIDELFNHKAFKSFNRENSDFKLNDFISYINQSKPVVIHGNFTDSIAYYQMTFPLKDAKGLTNFIQNKVDKINTNTTDSIVDAIKIHSKYSVYSPKNNDYTLAWNNNNFIVYGLVENNYAQPKYAYDYSAEVDSAAVAYDEEYYEEEYEDAPIEVIEVEEVGVEEVEDIVLPPAPVQRPLEAVTDENWEDDEETDYDDDLYYNKWLADRENEVIQERREKQVKQEEQVALLFDNDFVFPSSDKINTKADISSWVDYQSVYGKMNSFYYLFRTFTPNQNTASYKNVVKGMNVDFYFENDKARMEQTIEYSESLAKVMGKIIDRKPNKNSYNYFPKETPLAYMSYHSSTEQVLKSYPEITEQILANLPFDQQDTEIITDLVSTIVDEEATATLFDGDFSMFLHSMEPYEYTYTGISYDEDYNQVKEEKTMTKTRPIFTMIMTSTHPTMGDKLLNLGVRKNVLVKEGNHYVVKEFTEVGKLALLKDGDVFVITNGLNYLNNGSKSDFSKQVKKELSKNYLYGNFEMQRFMKSMLMSENFGKDTEKMLKVSNQFKNIEFKSSNKIKGNKMKVEMEMNSNFSDKNIILQTLDLVDYLN
ncbi:DUF4836 family protein [Flavobacterium sp. N2820]|uniref:DUF4836 family protein n=1 Tax=Flavobacterium sp. N2820 TaxID=2986834 RepID=UPI0022259A05|nr:DUF4836 family protein [Flavobacterium sp. N2820]